MLNINEEDLKAAIVEKAAGDLINDEYLTSLVANEVKARVDKIFVDRAEAQISLAIDDAIKTGFEREFQRTSSWGEPTGPKTSIRAELEKMVGGYWNTKVDKYGKPSDGYGDKMTRAEYLMTQICSGDFSEAMKQSALNVTGALKDGLRNQLAAHMDEMLNSLFHVKSLQDQGKVSKPY